MATSTATEPDSEKNTRSRSPGSSAASRRASVSACSCTSPPNITCGIVGELALDRLRGCADGCSRGRRSTTTRCRRSARGRRRARCGSPAVRTTGSGGARGLHLRIGQPDVVEPGLRTSRAASLRLDRSVHSTLSHCRHSATAICPLERGHSDALTRRLRAGQARRHSSARSPAPQRCADTDRARRHLGRAQRPAAAVVLLQRLSQPDPSSGASRTPRSQALERYGVGAGASRLVTGNHPLYAELEARLARLQGHRGGLRVRLRLSRQCRHHPGAGRRATISSLIDELAHACLWAGAQLSRGDRACPSATTTSTMLDELLAEHRARITATR